MHAHTQPKRESSSAKLADSHAGRQAGRKVETLCTFVCSLTSPPQFACMSSMKKLNLKVQLEKKPVIDFLISPSSLSFSFLAKAKEGLTPPCLPLTDRGASEGTDGRTTGRDPLPSPALKERVLTHARWPADPRAEGAPL
mmetsp:Transcript_30986/g.61097  ORF Transcript_30986/g.61097 Transcript_30986/m.61097 type:complete len:140 (-) Transcript_30986:1693-2112(-)